MAIPVLGQLRNWVQEYPVQFNQAFQITTTLTSFTFVVSSDVNVRISAEATLFFCSLIPLAINHCYHCSNSADMIVDSFLFGGIQLTFLLFSIEDLHKSNLDRTLVDATLGGFGTLGFLLIVAAVGIRTLNHCFSQGSNQFLTTTLLGVDPSPTNEDASV